jgi:hypothetical protein
MIESKDDLKCLKGKGPCIPEPPSVTLEAAVGNVVRSELSHPVAQPPGPHEPHAEPEKTVTAADYFTETKPRWNLALFWKFFRNLVGSSEFSFPKPRVKDYVAAIAPAWPTPEEVPTIPATEGWANKNIRTHYAWSDKLADRYGDAYRSTYLFIYLAAAFAVFLALLPMTSGSEDAKFICVPGEFVLLSGITFLLFWEDHHRWHKRWMAYRVLAELIRQLKCLLG